jgi:hypothetical protein
MGCLLPGGDTKLPLRRRKYPNPCGKVLAVWVFMNLSSAFGQRETGSVKKASALSLQFSAD